jgi:hypothetical protein
MRLLRPLATVVSDRAAGSTPSRNNSLDAAFREVNTALEHLSAVGNEQSNEEPATTCSTVVSPDSGAKDVLNARWYGGARRWR